MMTDHHDSPAASQHAAAHDAHGDHSVMKYIYVFVALCVLTGASFFTYSSAWPLGHYEAWAFMMLVSCTKAALVILFFMHLKYEADWKYVLTIPASIMSIFLVLALVPDIGWRVRGAFNYGYSADRLARVGTQADTDELVRLSQEIHGHGHGDHGHAPADSHGH